MNSEHESSILYFNFIEIMMLCFFFTCPVILIIKFRLVFYPSSSLVYFSCSLSFSKTFLDARTSRYAEHFSILGIGALFTTLDATSFLVSTDVFIMKIRLLQYELQFEVLLGFDRDVGFL